MQDPDEDAGIKPLAKSFFGCRFEEHNKLRGAGNALQNKSKGCAVCLSQVNDGHLFATKASRKLQYYQQPAKEPNYTFQQLVKDLIPDSNNPKERLIKGCEVFMPDTLFFKDGRPEFIA